MKIIETESQLTSQDITSEIAAGSYTATYDLSLSSQMRLSALNAAAATLTVGLRLKTSGDVMIGEWIWSEPKRTATDTVFSAEADAITAKSGEKVEWRVLSSNASDTAATIDIFWTDESAVNAYQVDFSTSAAENVASVFNGTGHTDGVTMAAERLLLSNDDASNAAFEIVNADASGTAMETDGGNYGQQNNGGNYGQWNNGGDYGQYNDGSIYGQWNNGGTGSVQNSGAVSHDSKNTGTLQDVDIAAVSGGTTSADNMELQYDGTGLTGDTFPATQLQGDTIETDIGALNDLDATEAEAAALAAITSYDASTGTEVASIASDIAALNDLSQAEAETAVEAATFSTPQYAAVALAAASLDATQLSKRQVNKVTLASTGTGTATQIVFDDDGTTPLTTQLVTDDGTTQTQGAAS